MHAGKSHTDRMRVAARINRRLPPLLLTLALGEYRRSRYERFPPVTVPAAPAGQRGKKPAGCRNVTGRPCVFHADIMGDFAWSLKKMQEEVPEKSLQNMVFQQRF